MPVSRDQPDAPNPRAEIRRATIIGFCTIALLLGTVGLWAATAPLSGAIIASGKVVVESNVRRIQHPSGGIVAEINVKDGDHVEAGEVLVRLVDTNARASLALIEIELLRFQARKARLEAERDGLPQPDFPLALHDRATGPEAQAVMASESRLFDTRQAAADVQRAQFRERILQAHEETRGLNAQIEARRAQAALIATELQNIEDLFAQKLVSLSRLTSLQREASRLEGEIGSLLADIARTKGRVAEIELQILQIDQDLRREASGELRDIEGKIADLTERRVAARDQLDRIELRAPQAGVVHQLSVHTIGGVISPAEQIMQIVPATDGLVIEARIDPAMIDRLHIGQTANLMFPAFDSTTTPELAGRVTHLSPDASTDPQTGMSYFTTQIALDASEVAKLGDKELLPGMPVEAFIQTGSRTALAYLVKPVSDQLSRSFRYD